MDLTVCPYAPVLKMSSSVNREVSYAYLHPSYLNHGLVWKISEKAEEKAKKISQHAGIGIKSGLKVLKDYFWPLADKKCYILIVTAVYTLQSN